MLDSNIWNTSFFNLESCCIFTRLELSYYYFLKKQCYLKEYHLKTFVQFNEFSNEFNKNNERKFHMKDFFEYA